MGWHHLTAFGSTAPPHWQLRASIQRLEPHRLSLSYELVAPAAEVIWPATTSNAQRRDELWNATCLELFIAKAHDPGYREVNLSPSGDWNVYQLDHYRQGLRPDGSIDGIEMHASSGVDRHRLEAIVRLPEGLIGVSPLQANLCAVLQSADHHNSYWAIHHPCLDADFHHRDGFVLEL